MDDKDGVLKWTKEYRGKTYNVYDISDDTCLQLDSLHASNPELVENAVSVYKHKIVDRRRYCRRVEDILSVLAHKANCQGLHSTESLIREWHDSNKSNQAMAAAFVAIAYEVVMRAKRIAKRQLSTSKKTDGVSDE